MPVGDDSFSQFAKIQKRHIKRLLPTKICEAAAFSLCDHP